MKKGFAMTRFRSRKFIVSLLTQLAALAVLVFPQHESAILEASSSITALIVLALASLGYVAAEASVDGRRGRE
jgi:hypothetical protein